MKLYKEHHGIDMDGLMYKTATLDDLKAALAEHKMVAVPVEPDHGLIQQMEIEHQNCESYYMFDCMTAAYKAMTKAAEEENPK